MTYGQLALLRHVLEQFKEGENPSISNDEKVDLDNMHDYFNNLILDIEEQKKRGKVKEGGNIAYRLLVNV